MWYLPLLSASLQISAYKELEGVKNEKMKV